MAGRFLYRFLFVEVVLWCRAGVKTENISKTHFFERLTHYDIPAQCLKLPVPSIHIVNLA